MRDTLVVVFIAETDPDNVYQVCLKAVVNNGVLSTLGCYCRSSNDSLKLEFICIMHINVKSFLWATARLISLAHS